MNGTPTNLYQNELFVYLLFSCSKLGGNVLFVLRLQQQAGCPSFPIERFLCRCLSDTQCLRRLSVALPGCRVRFLPRSPLPSRRRHHAWKCSGGPSTYLYFDLLLVECDSCPFNRSTRGRTHSIWMRESPALPGSSHVGAFSSRLYFIVFFL